MRGVLLVFTLHFGNRNASDPWFGADKARHFFTSAFVQSASFSLLRETGIGRHAALVGATAVSSAAGIGKELYDKRFGGDPSLKDLAWDGAGIAAMTLVLRRTQP
jgi:putative lipoprotein